jgi:membrane associated rhomboid family serine protease
MSTFLFLVISAVFFSLTFFSPLLSLGAISRAKLRCSGQYHRLISSMFLHGSVFHFVCNTFAHFCLVLPMEAAWGRTELVSIYVFAAIVGGLFAATTSEVSVTASAGLFGVFGAYLALIGIYWNRLGVLVARLLLLYLCSAPLLFMALSFLPNVLYLSNLGGLIAGAAAGALIFATKADDPKRKVVFAGAGGVLLGGCVFGPVVAILVERSIACDV